MERRAATVWEWVTRVRSSLCFCWDAGESQPERTLEASPPRRRVRQRLCHANEQPAALLGRMPASRRHISPQPRLILLVAHLTVLSTSSGKAALHLSGLRIGNLLPCILACILLGHYLCSSLVKLHHLFPYPGQFNIYLPATASQACDKATVISYSTIALTILGIKPAAPFVTVTVL